MAKQDVVYRVGDDEAHGIYGWALTMDALSAIPGVNMATSFAGFFLWPIIWQSHGIDPMTVKVGGKVIGATAVEMVPILSAIPANLMQAASVIKWSRFEDRHEWIKSAEMAYARSRTKRGQQVVSAAGKKITESKTAQGVGKWFAGTKIGGHLMDVGKDIKDSKVYKAGLKNLEATEFTDKDIRARKRMERERGIGGRGGRFVTDERQREAERLALKHLTEKSGDEIGEALGTVGAVMEEQKKHLFDQERQRAYEEQFEGTKGDEPRWIGGNLTGIYAGDTVDGKDRAYEEYLKDYQKGDTPDALRKREEVWIGQSIGGVYDDGGQELIDDDDIALRGAAPYGSGRDGTGGIDGVRPPLRKGQEDEYMRQLQEKGDEKRPDRPLTIDVEGLQLQAGMTGSIHGVAADPHRKEQESFRVNVASGGTVPPYIKGTTLGEAERRTLREMYDTHLKDALDRRIEDVGKQIAQARRNTEALDTIEKARLAELAYEQKRSAGDIVAAWNKALRFNKMEQKALEVQMAEAIREVELKRRAAEEDQLGQFARKLQEHEAGSLSGNYSERL